MKIKSLLMAAAAFAALSTSAQTLSAPNIEITSEEDFGKVNNNWVLTLTLDEGVQYTNIEYHFTYPEGVYPAKNLYGVYSDAGNDVAMAGRVPSIAFSDNFDVAENWPHFKAVGANLSDTPNPGGEALILGYELRKPETGTIANGEYPITAYVKFNRADGVLDGREIGTPDAEVEFAKLIVNLPVVTAVNDIDAAKAVTSVKYYNAAGMESDKAFEGINIVVTKYADGSQSTAKVVK